LIDARTKMDNNDSEVYSEWPAQQQWKSQRKLYGQSRGVKDLAASARRGLLDVLARGDRRGFGISDTSRGGSHSVTRKVSHIRVKVLGGLDVPILDLLGHCQESLLNVGSVLRRSLEEGNVQLISEFLNDQTSITANTRYATSTNLRNAVLDDLLAGEVGLVANEELIHAFRGVTINFLEPLFHVGESVCKGE